jgi:hypothetical protein
MLGLTLLGMVMVIRAGEQNKQSAPTAAQKAELAAQEQQLARQFEEFQLLMLKLKQRMDRGTAEEQARAKAIGRILDDVQKGSLKTQFDQLAEQLRTSKLTNTSELKELSDRAARLTDELQRILQMFQDDPRQQQLREEAQFLRDMIRKIGQAIEKQKLNQGLTEAGKTEKNELKQNQNQITGKVGDLNKAIDNFLGKKGDGVAKDGKGLKGGPKEGGKNEQSSAQAKGEGEQPKQAAQGETKDSGSKSGEAPKTAADAKPGAKGSPSQAKPGEGNKAEAKAGSPSESQAKQGGQPSKGSKSSQGQAKSGSTSKGQSQAKSDGAKSPMDKQNNNQQAQAKQDQGDHGAQSTITKEGDGAGKKPGNQKTRDELAKNQKKILEAGYESIKAEHEIIAGKKKPAVEKQEEVIKNLEDAKKELEKLLRQTREEELERLLAALEARCRKMLEMQIAVLAGTEQTNKAMLAHKEDKTALRADQQSALKLSDQEKEIIQEANKAIQMLEEEGSAVAFPEVFQQVREDMKHVQRRLEIADVGDVTQAVEKDIIESLKEMIEALKKAQQQNKSSGQGQPPPNADQKLLDKIAELKMIRSLQKRVNDRTSFYGRLFPNEQALDANIRQSLQQLAERQERIFEIMDRFAKGDGK